MTSLTGYMLRHIYVLCLLVVGAQSANQFHHRHFLNFTGKLNFIRNLALDKNTSTLYVGGRNILFAVDTDSFTLLSNFSTNTNCGETICTYENESLVLEVISSDAGAYLLTCFTPSGICEKRNLIDLKPNTEQKRRIASSAVISNVARLVNTRHNGEILYFARNYSNFTPPSYDYFPILAANPDDDFSRKSDLSIEIADAFKMEYPIDFKAIVESDNFVYFLSNQAASTKISKICKNSPAKTQAYEDMNVTCSQGNTQFPYVKDAVMLKENGQFALVALFTQEQESDDPRTQGAICVFSENQILRNFLKSRKQRFECPGHHLPYKNYIFKNVVDKLVIRDTNCIDVSAANIPPEYNKSMHEQNYCASGDPGLQIVIGLHTLDGEADVILFGSPTNLTARQIGTTSAFYVGDSRGTVREFSIELDSSNDDTYDVKEFNTFSLGVREKVIDMETSKDSLFVATRKRIVKIQDKGCSQFKTCNTCMAARITKCGWCVMEAACTDTGSENCIGYQWLPAIKKKCLEIILPEGGRQEVSGAAHFKVYVGYTVGNAVIPSGLVPDGITYVSNSISNIYLSEPQNTLSLTFSPMISTSNLSLMCGLEGTPNSTLEYTEGIGKCNISGTGSMRQNLTKLSEGIKMFSVYANTTGSGNNAYIRIAKTEFYIYNCSTFKTCFDCCSERSCRWNPSNSRCDTNGQIARIEQCPYVIGNQNLKVAYNKSTTLVFNATNLQTGTGGFRFYCKIDQVDIQFMAVQAQSNFTCKNVTISKNAGTDVTNRSVKIAYQVSGTDFVIDTLLSNKRSQVNIEVYSCEALLRNFASGRTDDCSSCKYLKAQGYDCTWCGTSCQAQCPAGTGSTACGSPKLINIMPNKGPIQGGTRVTVQGINLGLDSTHINVTIGGQTCSDVIFDASRRLVCTTGELSDSADLSKASRVIIQLQTVSGVLSGSEPNFFNYKAPSSIRLIDRKKGIRSGNATVTFESKFIDEQATIKFVRDDAVLDCVLIPLSSEGKVRCLSPAVDSDKTGIYNITVMYGGVNITLNDTYEIIPNPEIEIPSELVSIRSGGTELKISGKQDNPFDFGILSRKMLRVGNKLEKCTIKRGIENAIFCMYPPLSSRKRRRRDVGEVDSYIQLDGWEGYLGYVRYVEDPKFRNLTSVFEYDPSHGEKNLELTGENLDLATKNPGHYTVYIGSGRCHSENLTSTLLSCDPPEKEPSPWRGEKKLIIRVKIGFTKHMIVGEAKYVTEFEWYIAVTVALSVTVILVIIVMAIVIVKVKRKSKRREHKILMEMQRMEDELKEEGKDEFATMQLTITNIKTDLVSTGLPFNAYDVYIMKILFPTAEHETINKTLLHKELVPSVSMKTAMEQFEGLLRNKFFVRCLIGSLERQKKITMQDKAQLSSLLTLVYLGKMKDFYEIVECLLESLVDSTPKKQHRVIFNRFENITLRLLINWLYIALFPHFKDGGGTSLFMLYKAILTVVEKRPVDCVTGDAKNTLSQHRFLRCKVDFNIMTLTIDLNGDGHEFSCEVLDCDTISQVKQKCLRQIYKNRPTSQMPSSDELILEWKMGHCKLALNDFDHTSVRDGNKIQMNTLKHYNVLDKSNMELRYKFSPPNPDDNEPDETYENFRQQASPTDVVVQMPSFVTEETLEKMERWHLEEVMEESTPDDTNITARHLKEEKGMHITSLMHTKLILQEYIRTVLDQILEIDIHPIVHYVFGTLNVIAESNGVDPDVLQCWKSESYAIRIWASLVATPDVLFDVDRPKHIEPSLESIRQLIIDCFHNTKITKDSSLQKLLFATEVPEYQKKTEVFYKRLSQLECIGEGQFANEMTKLSNMQQSSLDFKKLPVLLKVYKFIQSYIDDVLEDLDENDDAKGLKLRTKLENVIEQMDKDE